MTLEKDLEDQRAFTFNSAKLASLGEMAAGIAHEINNPLTIISGSIFKIKRRFKKLELEDEELDKSIQRISDTTKRIADIVKSMRTISRDGNDDENVMVNLGEIVEEGVFLISEKIKMSLVDLDINVGEENSQIYGKATQVSQIVMNLISNSLDALCENEIENKIIRVETKDTTSHIILSISDNAGGIPQEIVEKIFNPFFTTKEVGKGTGLGLSLSKSIMENHGGELKLTQKNGLTTFSLFFPKDISNIEGNTKREAA